MDKIILDTNVLLDWLVFNEPGVQPVRDAIESGQLSWLACAAMRRELEHMLGHPSLARWQPDLPASLAAFDRWSIPIETAETVSRARPATTALRCSDPDDQVFVDLALAQAVRWLLSRDRALLKLAPRARKLGISIVTPEAFAVARQP